MPLFRKWCKPQESNEPRFTFDDGLHTPRHPYCEDPGHPCHTDATYHDEVLASTTTVEEMDELLDAAWTLFHNAG